MPEFNAAVQVSLKSTADGLHAEFDEIHTPERVDAVLADSVEQISKDSKVESFVPALAGRLARERLRALAQSAGTLEKSVPEVLFLGLHDSGRGQMAAALMRALGGDRVNVSSAATGAFEEIDPVVRAAMEEIGVPFGDAYSKPLTQELLDAADVVVTMGRSVGSVTIPESARHIDWRVGDPGGASIYEVRLIRDDIANRVRLLIAEIAPLTVVPVGAPTA